MKNFKLVKTTAALALGASVVTAAVVPGTTSASAASKYKVTNGKLVNAKTGKVVKGYVVFKSKLYYNGKLKKGYKTVGSGKTIKLYYNGSLKKGYKTARNSKLLFFNGSLKKGYKSAGSGERLYKDGFLAKGYEVYGDVDKNPKLYYNGYLKSGYKTANNATLLFYNGELKKGYKTAKEGTVLYKDGRLNEGLVELSGVLYDGSKQNEGKKLFEGTLYDGAKRAIGLVKFEEKYYNDGVLANGEFVIDGEKVTIENGVLVGADKEAPVLKVEGDTTVIVENGAELKLPVVTATDNNDKEVEVKSVITDAEGKELDKIDTKVAGTYKVTYSAEDAAGNKAENVVVTVVVKEGEVKLEDVKAINAKTLEVKFNQAVETDKAVVELMRGAFKQNVTLNWSEDKKSVELVGANNFQPAEYTVNVTGLGEKTLTGTVKVEAQKVESIEILDDIAVVSDAADTDGKFTDGTTASVGYVVKDQYGVDITKTASLKTNDDTNISLRDGVITLKDTLVEGKKVGDLVPVVLIDTNTGISTTKTVKLSAESTVSDIAVDGIYNAKGEAVTLNDTSKASEAFIVLNLKDQYGKEITNADKAAGLVVTNTNTNNLVVDSKVSAQKIGDKDKLVIKINDIKRAGDTDVLLISTTNGKSAKYTVKVAETTTTDAITVGKPEVAVVNEDTLIPVTVTDKSGNVITDTKLLSDANKGIKLGSVKVDEKDLVVKDGQVFLKYKFIKEGTQALVLTTSTYKVATVTIDVKAEAVATAIRGLKNPLVVKAGAENAVTITSKDNLIIEDQYGRVMKDNEADIKVEAVGTTDVVKVEGTKVTGLKNGTATLKIQLLGEDKGDSAVEVKVQVTDGKEYKSYEVKDLGLLDANENNNLVVSGVLENGGKVNLKGSDYVATTNVDGVTVENGVLKVDPQANVFTVDGKAVDTREVKVTFTINNDGSKVEHTYKISNAASTVQDFFFASTDSTNVDNAKEITELDKEGTFSATDLSVVTTDQYGLKELVSNVSGAKITIIPTDASKVNISQNGTASASVVANADTTVTVRVQIGNAVKDLKVNLKASSESKFIVSTNKETDANEATLGLVGTAATSSNSDVATARIDNGKVEITSVKAGTATITVKDASENAATIAVTVNPDGTIKLGTIAKYQPSL